MSFLPDIKRDLLFTFKLLATTVAIASLVIFYRTMTIYSTLISILYKAIHIGVPAKDISHYLDTVDLYIVGVHCRYVLYVIVQALTSIVVVFIIYCIIQLVQIIYYKYIDKYYELSGGIANFNSIYSGLYTKVSKPLLYSCASFFILYVIMGKFSLLPDDFTQFQFAARAILPCLVFILMYSMDNILLKQFADKSTPLKHKKLIKDSFAPRSLARLLPVFIGLYLGITIIAKTLIPSMCWTLQKYEAYIAPKIYSSMYLETIYTTFDNAEIRKELYIFSGIDIYTTKSEIGTAIYTTDWNIGEESSKVLIEVILYIIIVMMVIQMIFIVKFNQRISAKLKYKYKLYAISLGLLYILRLITKSLGINMGAYNYFPDALVAIYSILIIENIKYYTYDYHMHHIK